MSRARKYPYIDVFLSRDEVKKIKSGKACHRVVKNGKVTRIAIRMKSSKAELKIEKLKKQIAQLRKGEK